MVKSMIKRIDTDPSERVTIEVQRVGATKIAKTKHPHPEEIEGSVSFWILSPSINSDRAGDSDEYGAAEENANGNATTPFE